MVKKLQLRVFLLIIFLAGLNMYQVQAQCPDAPTTSASATINLQGSNTICSNESVSFSSNIDLSDGTNPAYQWQKQIGTGSWTDISNENATTLSNYSDVQNNTKFRLAIIFCNGSSTDREVFYSNTSSTITVVQSTVATISISASNTNICPGTSITFNKTPTNQGSSPSYSWRVNGTEVSTSSNFSYDQFNDGDNVQVFMTSNKACATDGDDSDGDNAAESNIISISVKDAIPDQPATINGPASLCSNTGATYSISAVDRATSYQWILPSGWTGSSTSTSIDITSGNVATGQIIRVKALNDCGESTESTITVDVGPGIPSNPGTISGPSLICPGDIVIFSVTEDPDVSSYTWSLPSNWSIQGAIDGPSITAIAGGTNDDGTVTVFSTNDCEDSNISSLSVNVNDPAPAAPGNISGPTTVCPDTEVDFSISSVNYADEYIWYVDNAELSGQNGTSISINSGAEGTRNIKVIAVNECVDPADYSSISGSTLSVTVDDGTPADTSITESEGSTDFCPGETDLLFSVPQDARIDTYDWTVPSGWTITGGTGTHEITVTSGQLGNDGNIEFTGTSNDCGSVTTTYAVSVKNPAPIVSTEAISGEAKVCRDATGLSYTLPSIQYADNYVWTVPGNWNITGGQGTNTITVSAGSDDGNITVYAENDCGQTSIVSFPVESIDAAPAAPGTIESTDAFEADPKICPPLNPLYLSVPFVSDEISYNWTLPQGWEIIGDETSNEINVNVTAGGSYNDTETVQVTATNGCFTSAANTSFAMTISDYIITDLGEDQTVCSTINQITIPGEIRFGNSKKFNPTYTAINGDGTNVSNNISGLPTNFNNYPNTFNFSYNASAADKASGSVTISVQVPPPATTGNDPDACGTGYAEMTIFFRPEPTASITATPEVCEGQTAEVTFTATPNTTLTYSINSGSNQTIQIGDTGESAITTTALSGDTTYSITNIQYTEAPNCSTAISESATILVNPSPSVDISYADHCSSETTSATVSYANEIGNWDTGTFSATGALGTEIQNDGSFIPANVTPGTYTVTYEITGSGGCENISVTTDVTIYEEVIITQSPSEQRTCEGGNAEFQVIATGEGLSYQWYKGTVSAGNEISGATGNILNLTNIDITDAGDYLVVVSGIDPCSSKTSTLASLIVDQNISIDNQPANLTVCEGEDTSLSVSASVGGNALDNTYSYQWFKGSPGSGTLISGMNSSSIPFNAISPDDSGSYYVEITGPAEYQCSKIISEAAIVTVRPIPTAEISGTTSICSGDSTEINFFNGIPGTIVTYRLNGDNNNQASITLDSNGEATLETGNLQATNGTDTDFIYEIISVSYSDNPDCIQTYSAPLPSATVTVAANPDVTISFTNGQTEFCTADNTLYTPSLTGTGVFSGGTWSANGISVDNSSGAFTPGNENSGDYTITYTVPGYGGCAEQITTLDISIYEEVQITSQPTNLGICSTNDAEFFVGASGDQLTYQWYKDGNAIEGATSATLSLPVATSVDAGDYYAMVSGTNACTPDETAQIQSETVTLNVDEDIIIIEPAEDVRVCEDSEESVTFKFVAHANGSPLTFEWIYADGTLVNPDGTRIVSNVTNRTDYPGLEGTTVYEGTLSINNITSADQASYAVRIDGSGNNFNCPEAVSNSFNLDVDPLPEPPTSTSPIEYCLDETAEALTATGDTGAIFTWYDSENNELSGPPTPDTSVSGTITYYVTQKDTYCESPQTEVVVTVFDTPSAPVLSSEEENITYCLGDTASALTIDLNGAASANWYDSESSSTPLSGAPTPQTSAVGTINYWVSLINNEGCESEKAMISVYVSPLPDIILPADQEICEGDTFEATASDNNESSANTTTYSWNWVGNEGDPLEGAQQNLNPTETTTYTVTATNENGCINTAEITINVDPQPVGGTLEGPSSVCETNPSGELNLNGYSGTISRWESKAQSASDWTAINEETPDANLQFSGLIESTSYRVVISSGVCEEVYSNELTINLDPEPQAGQVLFNGSDRVFMMCEFPTDDYLVPLQTTGTYIGEIVAWQYRRNSQTDWTTIIENGENFTGTTLSGAQVNLYSANESTLFRVEVQSGACEPNVYSDYATLSIIPSDIAPSPVQMTPGEVCLGEVVTMSSQTGYGGSGTFEGGAFDNSSIANHGWRVMRYGSGNDGTEYTFQSAADNTRPDRWMRTNPHEYIMADPSGGSGTVWQEFDSCSCDEGNKGFAIVSGDNPSTLETPVFNTYTMDNPTLTFDQAYNLTAGDTIKVQISLDGGNTYEEEPLFVVGGPALSGNYNRFGDDGLGEPNNMEIDLSNYAGLDNLRIRWLYDGTTGGIYTIDDIGIPQDPQNVQLIWYYDEDINDDSNPLEQIGEINQQTVTYPQNGAEWPKIGWNDFEVQTALVFDTNGDPCESAENSAVASVYVFDNYTSTATALVGQCGNTDVQLSATISGTFQGEITEFPEGEGSTVAWEVIEAPAGYEFAESHFVNSDSNLAAINDPNAVFQPPLEGNYTIRWTITPNESQTTRNILGEMITQDVGANPCPMTHIDTSFEFIDCTTLDFDGDDDYIDLGNNYNGNYFIEAWIRPFDRPLDDGSGDTNASSGVIFSSSGMEIRMENLPTTIVKNTRWYHIAVSNNGELWVDGISAGSIDISGSGINNTSIGARYNANTKLTSNHFSGWIEELRIWTTPPSEDEIRFMMNQRIQLNDGAAAGTPIEGEVVPNRSVAGSYLVDGNGNNQHFEGYEESPQLIPFYDQTWGDLAGYYRLYSDEPDPDNLIPGYFDPALEPENGYTPDHSISKVPGRLYNITTNQENTSPTPYFDDITKDGQDWETDNTWARPDVWDAPNSLGIDETPIEWNIARINTNITSANKNITMLGILSETVDKELTIESDQFIRVSHYLLLDGNMDLVGESQLLQDHGSILAEQSQGWLQRDQQGRMSSYNYNYWSSPVSDQGTIPNNAPYTISQVLRDGTNPATPGDNINYQGTYHAADHGGPTSPITLSTYWMWKFARGRADDYSDWRHVEHTGTMETGEGYTMKGTSGIAGLDDWQNYTFQGKPHNGNILFTIGENENYLLGNPYPSALDANEFIWDNLKDVANGRNTENVFNGTLYFWDHFAGQTHYLEEYIGGYAAYTLAGGVPGSAIDPRIDDSGDESGKIPERYIPVAQGFFLLTNDDQVGGANTDGGTLIIKNSQRSWVKEADGPSIFLKPEYPTKEQKTANRDDRAKIRLKFKSPKGYSRQILATKDDNTSDGYDIGYDAPLADDNLEDMYWLIDEKRYVIQAVPDFHEERVLPIGIKIDQEAEFTFKIDSTENWPQDKELYLKDKELDTIHDILGTAYKTTASPGRIEDRFELVFKKEVEETEEPPVVEKPETEEPVLPEIPGLVDISYSHFSKQIKIGNYDLLDISKVMIFNMNGKLIQEFEGLPTEKEIMLGMRPVRTGVYIVKAICENGVCNKKIIIK